jgi:hypothetical protein
MDDATTLPVLSVTFPAPYGQIGEYEVGLEDVTRIEQFGQPGLHCDLPYLRVWKGEKVEAEISRHSAVLVRFGLPTPPYIPDKDPAHEPDNPRCTCLDCVPF